MPQMSPMYWTILIISITIVTLQMNSLIYFNQNNLTKKKINKKKKKLNWKW